MKFNFLLLCLLGFLLSACGNNPSTYISAKDEPIVNIEVNINDLIEVSAEPDALSVTNKSTQKIALAYKLFWYNNQGVSQASDFDSQNGFLWREIELEPTQKQSIALTKPTDESVNYRIYLRGDKK